MEHSTWLKRRRIGLWGLPVNALLTVGLGDVAESTTTARVAPEEIPTRIPSVCATRWAVSMAVAAATRSPPFTKNY